uniref:ribosomal protection-like ABC-F family protein n=1 Tax=Lysinibacillus sp. FSL K6-3209 TaxID=2921497 RepID=UPI00403EF81A
MMKIEIKNLNFSFDTLEQPIFRHINLNIDTTWRLGLIGRNGRGKTTFLNLLMQKYPYEGDIICDIDFVYFPQTIANKKNLTFYAIEEIMDLELWKLERECQLLSLDKEILWQPFEQLSGGEQTKVLLAATFCEESKYPLLDEPTNHLDINARRKVSEYLKRKKGYIVVSHDRHFIDEVVDHIIVIEKNQLNTFKGNFSTYEKQKQLQDQYEIEQNNQIKVEIERLKKTSKEKANWAIKRERNSGNDAFENARAARMMKKSKVIEKRMLSKIEEKTKLLKNIESVDSLKINCLFNHRDPVLRAKNFSLAFNDRLLFKPITCEIFQGEQVALVGPNGSGKTTLLNYIINSNFYGTINGELTIPQGITKSIIRQHYNDNAGILKDFATAHHLDYTLFLQNLRILGVERDVFRIPIEKMSYGQMKKVEFSKSLGTPAEFFIWDEPLNYLDIFNQKQIESMIEQFKPTLLFVEHDQSFIANIATKIIEINPFS